MKSFQEMNPDHLAGQSPFVAAFASTNLGDVSPNTDGPKCQDTGLPCDIEHSTCDGRFDGLLLCTVTIIFYLGPKCASPLVLEKTCLSQPRSLLSASTGKKTAQKTDAKKTQLNCRVARKLLLEPVTETEVEGPMQFIHQWIDMSQVLPTQLEGMYTLPCIGSCDSCKRVNLTYLPPCPWLQLCSRNH